MIDANDRYGFLKVPVDEPKPASRQRVCVRTFVFGNDQGRAELQLWMSYQTAPQGDQVVATEPIQYDVLVSARSVTGDLVEVVLFTTEQTAEAINRFQLLQNCWTGELGRPIRQVCNNTIVF